MRSKSTPAARADQLAGRATSAAGWFSGVNGERVGAVPFYLLVPTVLFLVVVVLVPFILGFYVSLTDLNQYTIANWQHAPFIGLSNYVAALTQPGAVSASFPQSIWASVSFSIVTTVAIVPRCPWWDWARAPTSG